MTENVITLSRTQSQTQKVLLKKIREQAEALFKAADRDDDRALRRSAAEIIGITSGELSKMEKRV